MSSMMNGLFVYTSYLPFLVGSIVAQICLQKFSIDTAMQCNRSTGDLQMDFRPYRRAYYFENSRTREINCTVNKPSNISILFHKFWKPITEEPRELSTTKSVYGMTLHRLNGGCTSTIRFPDPASQPTICNIGMFTCKAVTDTNETVSMTQKVDGDYALGVPPFTFTIEDPELQKTNELILGTSANLSCSFATRSWGTFGPFILYWQISDYGNITEVLDSNETPRRYESQGSIKRIKNLKYDVATRKLFLRRIGEDANRTFLCRVTPYRFGDCKIEKRLQLRTRPCKAGYYCDQNSSKELPCTAGTYSNTTGLFDKSGCRTCPLDAYCPSGSPLPIPCPVSQFLPARDTTLKIYEGKRNNKECRSCPVNPCDGVAEQCAFICGNKRFEGILGQKFSVRCSLSNGTLMRNLTWYKGKKEIVDSVPYRIDHGEKELVLTIDKLSLEDSGIYVCSGYDRIMGNQFNSTIRLDVTDSEKASKKLLTVLLSISLAVLLIALIGILGYRHWRRNRFPSGSEDGRIKIMNEIETLPISESFQPDLRTVYEGNTEEKYDVFICYSSADKTWVRRTLLPTLKDVNLRVCIDFEDFNAGSFIIENVADAIFSSRKTLAVLSPDFLCSAWCQKELMMALTRVRDRHKVIPVMYRSCEVPFFLSDVTYLDWCNEDVRETFWEQLIRTIDDRVELEIDNGVCNTTEIETRSTTDL